MSNETYLLLGGAGFIGRNLVSHLLETGVSPSCICAVDKVMLKTAWMHQRHLSAFQKIKFTQANLCIPDSVEKVFKRADGSTNWDYVVNLCGVYSGDRHSDASYKKTILDMSLNCAKAAAKYKAKVYVEFSTSQVYKGANKKNTEDGALEPWTFYAKTKLKCEQELGKLPDLNLVILRPVLVYGSGDRLNLTKTLICARVKKEEGNDLSLLWDESLEVNTVHVEDVCRAVVAVCKHYADKKANGVVFNLADKSETNQGLVAKRIKEIFDVNTTFIPLDENEITHEAAESMAGESMVEYADPWLEILIKHKITHSPLYFTIEPDMLLKNHFSADGSAIEKALGFVYSVPTFETEKIRQVITDFQEQSIWPKN